MSNLNYTRSRARETSLKHKFEKLGYYSIRAAGSKGIADVIAIKPSTCGDPTHFEVRFIQVKVSEKTRKEKTVLKMEDTPFGLVNVEYMKFPVKSKKWHKRNVKKKNIQSRKSTKGMD